MVSQRGSSPWIRDIVCNARRCRRQGSQGNMKGRENTKAKGKGKT